MKKIFLMFLLSIWAYCVNAQYSSISVGTANVPKLKIKQVDYREYSTLVFLEYNIEGGGWANYGDKTYIKVENDDNIYHLLNAINIPLNTEAEPRRMIFQEGTTKHHFVLEFEKIPKGKKFDLIEDASNPRAFNFYDVNINFDERSEFCDINNYIKSYPIMESGSFFQEGTYVTYIKYKGIELYASLFHSKDYGNYYSVNLDICNFSGRNILFNPSNIEALGYKYNAKTQMYDNQPMIIVSADEYAKKIRRAQTWASIGVALGEFANASSAGYSSSTTSYAGSAYGYSSQYGSSYATAYGQSHTTNYNGTEAYYARQQAAENSANFDRAQYEIRQKLNDGYIKMNTIKSQVEYTGYLNLKYVKLDNLTMIITIDGIKYPLYW